MSLKVFILKILRRFPLLDSGVRKARHKLFPPLLSESVFIKNTEGFLVPNKKLYSAWVRKLYSDLIPAYKPKRYKSAMNCLNEALKRRVHSQPSTRTKQLFVDISVLIDNDHGTGIQRVVRNTLSEFLRQPPNEYHVEPVYGGKDGIYRYARLDEPIDVFKDDIFLGLDLIAGWTSRYWDTFYQFKAYGGKLYFVVYDLLPINYPDFFAEEMQVVFSAWLQQITLQADGAICISKTVANELKTWFEKNNPARQENFKIGWFHLGADIDLLNPNNQALPLRSFDQDLLMLKKNPSILMVSTIEPRKGYALALAAFDELWQKGEKINLVIVGKAGWKVDSLIKNLQKHPQRGKHLFWFQNISDALLLQLYQTCQGLLMASECEGFGLALIEAARHKLPILARDIPIFHEVSGNYAAYFSENTPTDLAETIKNWVNKLQTGKAPLSDNMPWLSWSQSTQQIIKVIIHHQWYINWVPTK